jgi:thiol-disulfide isomerase/thioredoxin
MGNKAFSGTRATKFVLLVSIVCLSLITGSIVELRPSHKVQAQDDPVQLINELAEAVHIQNLRTGNVTRWRGGDLGSLDGTEINAPAGTIYDEWYFTDLYDENIRVETTDLTRPVTMNVWASWCGPCRFEFPFLAEIGRAGGTNYDLWFLNANDDPDAAQRFLRNDIEGGAEGLTLYVDPGDAYIRSIGLQVFPTTLLVDTDGEIILAHSGVVTRTVMEFFDAVAAAPKEGSIDVDSVEVPELVATLDPVDAASATPIVYFQQVAGDITDEQWQDVYSFEGSAGDEVTIDMNSTEGDFDAYLVLFGPDGERIAENDDGPNPPYSQIVTTLPENGTYILVATRFLERDGFTQGGYNLVVANGEQAGGGTTSSSNQILFDIPVSSRLTTDFTQASYLMDAQAGQTLIFTLEHDNPTEVVNLQVRLGAGERVVPFQPTENGTLTVEAEIPQDGSYSVYVSRPMRSRAGPITFTLTVSGTNADGSPATNAVQPTNGTVDENTDEPTESSGSDGQESSTALNYGESATGSIDDNTPSVTYEFEGSTGETVTIIMEAGGDGTLDTQLTLYGPDGTLRGANDDANMTTTNSELVYTLTDDGIYVVVASRYLAEDGTSFGDFTLTITAEEATTEPDTTEPEGDPVTPPTVSNPPANTGDAFEIEYGTTVIGTVDSTTLAQRYAFTGSAGDVITITMQATNGNLDSYLSVFDAQGRELVFNDDDLRGIGKDAAIRQFKLPADGTYIIVATRYGAFNGITAGSYELLISPASSTPPGA